MAYILCWREKARKRGKRFGLYRCVSIRLFGGNRLLTRRQIYHDDVRLNIQDGLHTSSGVETEIISASSISSLSPVGLAVFFTMGMPVHFKGFANWAEPILQVHAAMGKDCKESNIGHGTLHSFTAIAILDTLTTTHPQFMPLFAGDRARRPPEMCICKYLDQPTDAQDCLTPYRFLTSTTMATAHVEDAE